MKKHLLFAFLTLLILSSFLVPEKAATDGSFSPYVTDDGSIRRPTEYRAQWVHLGSWTVPDEEAPGYGFHDVYTQPKSVGPYRKEGKFPDGAVLVKEIRKVNSAELSTGKASWAGEIAVWFVMVKDRAGRFKDHPNWGKGWGWGLYKADDPSKNVSTDFEQDCIGCHIPAKKTDWVYVQGYPTLR